MVEFIDKTSGQDGTPLNRENMMALQGFENHSVEFIKDENGRVVSVLETFPSGTKTTDFDFDNNVVTETFVGEKTIIKTTTFGSDGKIVVRLSEVIS